MDLQAYKAEIVKFRATNVTKTVHATSYPAISPLRPELSQVGRTVLITGGGSGCGLNVAKSFVAAKAARVVIVGRRIDALAAAQKELEEEAAKLSSPSVILHRQCDVAVDADVEKVWADAEIGPVHVLIFSAASFQKDPKSLVDVGYKNLWPLFETNVKGNVHMTERFAKQTTAEGQSVGAKFLVNVSSSSIHTLDPVLCAFVMSVPGYGLTKNAGTLALQMVAAGTDPDQMQVVSFNPGVMHNETLREQFGVGPKDLPFDDASLGASFAVWLASREARFLHGRFVWASWDVEELATGELRKRIDEDSDFLKVGVVGLKINNLA